VRAGLGFDAHRFAEGRELVLGGVLLDHPAGLAGHSDGDVLSHAVVDALLGAAGLGDIGAHFPSSDERWRDASSDVFLEHARAAVEGAGLRVGNVDCVVICESPRIAVYREKMCAAIASALGIDAAAVSVKATTADTMGFTGRGEGIAAIAVAMLEER
jgi:2-C-methyl-D-erythritol 4-phosphate cytidylyltransferase/2-C-methyl-D-erythritol 2,4-cyclodiphosphate synthase